VNVATAEESYNKSGQTLELAIVAYDQALMTHVSDVVLRIAGTKEVSMTDIVDDMTYMKHHQQRDENLHFLHWLSPSYWEVEDTRYNYVSRRAPGTLHWITTFPEFESWRTVSLESGSTSLWLTGKPGVGKSILSACILDVLERAYPLVLCFFCRRTDPKLRTIRAVITTLAYQLARKIPEVREQLNALQLDGVSPKEITSNVILANKLLEVPWPKTSPEIFILLDGLDECQDSEADTEKLLSLLIALPNCRILVTSRHSHTIGKILHSATEIGVEHNKDDIDVYIGFKVQAVKRLEKAFKRENIDAVRHLGPRANGNFLWARLVLSEAENAITMKEFRSVLASPVPQELSRFYLEIIDRLERSRLGEFVKELLIWTIGSERALQIEELQTAMELSLEEEYIDFKELLGANLRSLVEIVSSPAGSVVQINHSSWHDFVTDPLLSKSYFIDPSFIQCHIAEICMQHLSQSAEYCSFTQYAALNWMEHINRAQEESVVSWRLLECFYEFFHGHGLQRWLMEEIRKDSSGRFYDYDIHTIVIGLRSWISKVIKSASYESTGDGDATELPMSPDVTYPMSSVGSSSAAVSEPHLIQWMRQISKSRTQTLHEIIGATLARLWIQSKFEECAEIVAAFKMAWKCLYLSTQNLGDEDDEMWKVSKKSGQRLEWNKPQSSGEIIDLCHAFGFNESQAYCSLNVAVALAEYKFDSDAINYLETATLLERSLRRYYGILGSRACKDRRVEDALLYFEFGNGDSSVSRAFKWVQCLPPNMATAMHHAAWGGHVDAVESLKELGEDVRAEDAYGRLPVHYAAGGGNVETMKALNGPGADLVVRDRILGLTPLHFAAQFGNLDVVKWLLENEAVVDARDRAGFTALLLAAREGEVEVVRWLLGHGADITATTNHADTVMHMAAWSGNLELVQWLEEWGVEITAKSSDGDTVLHRAAISGNLEVVKWLVARGADITVKADNGQTVLHWAARAGNLDVIQWLVENGIDMAAEDVQRRTVLHIAAVEHRFKAAKWFVQNGLDMEVRDVDGNTGLLTAAKTDTVDVIEVLVELGADVEATDNNGKNALDIAMDSGREEIVRWLLEHVVLKPVA
jgi:ankyrin repeat protein